jgi:predicted nucleic acid-binding protein
MELVVDANILFAALIRDGAAARLLFRDDLRLFAPEFLLEEFARHRTAILAKSGRPAAEFDGLLAVFGRRITLVPKEEIEPTLGRARGISPDPKDVPYLALALAKGIPIWSEDRALREGQAAVKVMRTADILKDSPHQEG